MRSFFALIRKDLKGYFDQPTGYILMVLFVGVAAWFFFFVSPFKTTSEASARDLFDFLPWLLAVFVPASTMRLLAEEQRDGTLEILLTQPIRGWVVLATKFISGLIFVNLYVLATLSIPISLQFAGGLDWGAIAAQYIGSFFLTAAFVSIGLFTSSMTRNQIVAFILGLFFNAALMIVDIEQVAISLPVAVSLLLEALSPVTHFASISRGVINLRDILYFVALVSTFLSASFLMIRSRTLSHQSAQYRNLQLGVAGLIVLSLLIGWFGNSIGGRLDLTKDKVFTLTEGTRDILDDFDDLLTVEVYLSKDPPPQVSLVGRDVTDFLEDFAANSDGNVKIIERYPEGDDVLTQRAQIAGIAPRQFNLVSQGGVEIKQSYLGISMMYANRRETIPFVSTLDGFEYRMATLAYKMVQDDIDRRTVGFLTGVGEKSLTNELRLWGGSLQQQYNVVEVPLVDDQPLDLNGIDVLVIAGASEILSDDVLSTLHSYVAGGGKTMVMVDTVQVDPNQFIAFPNQSRLNEFIGEYGVQVEDNVVFDVRSHETLSFNSSRGQNIMLPYPYWAKVTSGDNRVSGDVESVVVPWASSLGFVDDGVTEYIPVMATTTFGGVNYELGDVSPTSSAIQPENIVPEQLFEPDLGFALEGQQGSFRMVVVGDSDWLTDNLVNRSNGNLVLGQNLVDWLAQDDTLAEIRSKVISSRTLLFTSDTHRNIIQAVNIVGVPLLFVIVGIVRFIRRRGTTLRAYQGEK